MENKYIKYKTCRISKKGGLISIFNLLPIPRKTIPPPPPLQLYVCFCGITELTLLKDGLHLKLE
jgi:hypothetical protein